MTVRLQTIPLHAAIHSPHFLFRLGVAPVFRGRGVEMESPSRVRRTALKPRSLGLCNQPPGGFLTGSCPAQTLFLLAPSSVCCFSCCAGANGAAAPRIPPGAWRQACAHASRLKLSAALQLLLGPKPVVPRRTALEASRLPIGIRQFGDALFGRCADLVVRLPQHGRFDPRLVIEELGGIHSATSVRYPKPRAVPPVVRSSTM